MNRDHFSLSLLIFLLGLSACAPRLTQTPVPVITDTPTPPLPTPTLVPRVLTVCLGDEPNTLYPYGSPNSAARSVMSAIFDGPIDVVNYGYSPIILEKAPNIADGDAQVSRTTVKAGDQVVDASGNLVQLAAETKIRPAGCRDDNCVITYDGSSRIDMDQMNVTFTLLEGLVWSDGEPLTSADSVYAFGLASDPNTPGSKFLTDRTQTYEAADEQTVQWWGKPGYIDPGYYTNFWMPLPEHAWSQFSASELPEVDAASRAPLGWGPYMIQEWITGDHIRLTKNLNYFRADDGLPRFDDLVFRFVPEANAAITALMDGKCDLLDPSIHLDGQVGLLQQMQKGGQSKLFTAASMTMEWLGFGIVPASYDDGYNASAKQDRPDIFGDPRLRQAIALCLDRQKIVDTVLFGLSKVPNTYVPPDHILNNPNAQAYAFDPVAGSKILHNIGWVDDDNNPSTPRKALGVSRVPNGTLLILNYMTTAATQRRQVEDILAQSLAQCGVGVNPIFYPAVDLYAQGPAGPLFGRQFDLAEYSIGVDSPDPTCSWFTSSQIPNAANHWVGTNLSGYQNPEFDSACRTALQVLPEDPQYVLHQQAQAIFASDLPAVPLYLRLKVAAARPGFCGFGLDPSTNNALANIESFDYGPGCNP